MIDAETRIRMPDGTERVATTTVLDPGGSEVPVSTQVMPPGYGSVGEMTDPGARPFAVGHRGRSLDRPEFTMRAYTDAVADDLGALELSVARSSDGVQFGLHDQSISRVVGVPGLPNASAMTWEEISRYRVLHPGGGESALFMRASDLIETYGSTHVLFIDAKYQLTNLPPFWDLLATVPDALDRVVVKSYGNASWYAAQAASRGYTTWGYFYQVDYENGTLATHGASWSIVGMEYAATQAAWNAAKAFGVPVIGHICPNLTAAQTAIAKGADGLMLSTPAARPA